MNLNQVILWRSRAAKIAAVFCVLFVLSAVDGLVAGFRHPWNLFELLPGESAKINGHLGHRIEGVEELWYSSSTSLVQVSFEAVHTGFWFGGQMWRGLVILDPHLRPGTYTVTVSTTTNPHNRPPDQFRIEVFSDANSLQKNARSLIRRSFGVSPWVVFAFLGLLTAVGIGVVYVISHHKERLLRLEGMAEIFHTTPGENGQEALFSLGTSSGVKEGDRLVLHNAEGIPVGHVHVLKVSETDALALVESDQLAFTGWLVRKI
jgi:hypothetical protein